MGESGSHRGRGGPLFPHAHHCCPVLDSLAAFHDFYTPITTLGTLYPQTYELINPFILLYSTIGMFLWAGAFFLFISASQSGQLGGRLTGWWWQRRATPSQATG